MEGDHMTPTRSPIHHRIFRLFYTALVDNLGLKLFSLLIALLLWISVLGAEDVTTTEEAQVFFKVPDDKILISDVPNRIKLTVTGPWATMKSWSGADIKKGIDLSGNDIGPSTVYFEESLFSLPPGLKILRINPNQWTVNLAIKAKKIVPVSPIYRGLPAKGYVVKSVVATPAMIEVEGAQSDILILDEIPTEEIDITGYRDSFTTSTIPVRLSKNIQFIEREPILVTITIKKDLIERTFESIPITVRNSKHVTRLEPSAIPLTVMGPRQKILEMKASHVNAFLDASKEEGDLPNTESTREVEFEQLPDDIKIKAGAYTVKLYILSAEKPGSGK